MERMIKSVKVLLTSMDLNAVFKENKQDFLFFWLLFL